MPQLFSRIAPNSGFSIGNVGDYPLRRHPELALLVAEVIASWSNVDGFMRQLFIELMGGPADTAATVFVALEIQSAKMAAINAVADLKLSDPHKKLLRAILSLIKTNQKSRDKIAHWTWGDSPDIPDALLLSNPKDSSSLAPVSPDKILVYKERDFRDIIAQNERLAGFGRRFQLVISPSGPPGRDQLFDRLCSEPEIRDRLDRQA